MEIRVDCIYCETIGMSRDDGAHLYINKSKSVFFCQRCNTSGVWVGKLPSPKRIVENRYGNLDLFNFSIKGSNALANRVWDYALTRLPEDVVMDKARWSPDMERVFFPLWVGNVVRVWNARAIDGSEPKYLTHGQKSNYVYGLEGATDWAVLCEGPLDSLSSPNGIAIYGKCISDTQFSLIVSKFKKIYWALDLDTKGQKLVEAQKEKLGRFLEVVDLQLEQDPNSLGIEVMKERVE